MTSAPRLLLPDVPSLVAGFGRAVLLTPDGEIETLSSGAAAARLRGTAPLLVHAPATARRLGLPGFDTTAWQMLIAPARTPKPVLAKLNAEVNAIVQSDEVSKALNKMGFSPVGKGSLDELSAYVKSEQARWAPVIRNAGLAGTQ